MFKIAIVTPFGAEPRVDNYAEFILALGLKNFGHSVQFYTYKLKHHPNCRQNSTYKNLTVIRCRQRFGISPGLFFSLLRFRPQIVIYFHPRSFLSFTAYLAARCSGAKTISEIVGILHDPFIVDDTDNPIPNIKPKICLLTRWTNLLNVFFSRKRYEQWVNLIFHLPVAKADAIVAINKDEQNYIKIFYGRDSTLIYWAAPPVQIQPQIIQSTNDPIPDFHLLFIGKKRKRKGWDTVLETLAILKSQGFRKKLVFVCPDLDIKMAEQFANRLGISDQIFFLSQISNEVKSLIFQKAQYVVVPSRYEGFGLPVFEAFQAGKPVIATDIPVFKEFLEHKKNALLFPPGDAKSLAENIIALDHNPELAKHLVDEGHKTATQFTSEIMVDKFVQLFNLLLKK